MRRAPIGALLIFNLIPWSAFLLRSALRQAVGLAVHFQVVDVVGQTVEERAGQTFCLRFSTLVVSVWSRDSGEASSLCRGGFSSARITHFSSAVDTCRQNPEDQAAYVLTIQEPAIAQASRGVTESNDRGIYGDIEIYPNKYYKQIQ